MTESTQPQDAPEPATGALFGDLWHRYGEDLFEESVELFGMRFAANGFDLGWFAGKECLDVGCGGGRYVIAMSRLGAASVVGVDISDEGLVDARRRAEELPSVSFQTATALDLPFPPETFDFVCCSGVLHHTSDAQRGLTELVRVARPGAFIYLLLYGAGGLRWPTIMACRPAASTIGYETVDEAMRIAELPANKQRTFLDDLFVPLIDFYTEAQVESMLNDAGITEFQRWEEGKLDHEQGVTAQREELVQLRAVFEAVSQVTTASDAAKATALAAVALVEEALEALDSAEEDLDAGGIDDAERDRIVFGVGHHRILALRP